MQIKIDFRKKYFWITFLVMAVLTIGMLAYAFGTSDPRVFGHSAGEVYVDDTYTLTLKDAYINIINLINSKISTSDADNKITQVNDRITQKCGGAATATTAITCPDGYGIEMGNCYPLNDWAETKTFTVTVPGETIDTGYGIATMPDALYKATAESRIGSDGKREVRITQCSASPIYPGSCTADWADDSALCEYYVHDVTRMACYAVTTSRYSVKVGVGNNYRANADLAGGMSVVLGSFGPETNLGTVATPYTLTGTHAGGCSLTVTDFGASKQCIAISLPAKCIDNGDGAGKDKCACETGYRLLERADKGFWSFECIKD